MIVFAWLTSSVWTTSPSTSGRSSAVGMESITLKSIRLALRIKRQGNVRLEMREYVAVVDVSQELAKIALRDRSDRVDVRGGAVVLRHIADQAKAGGVGKRGVEGNRSNVRSPYRRNSRTGPYEGEG